MNIGSANHLDSMNQVNIGYNTYIMRILQLSERKRFFIHTGLTCILVILDFSDSM